MSDMKFSDEALSLVQRIIKRLNLVTFRLTVMQGNDFVEDEFKLHK